MGLLERTSPPKCTIFMGMHTSHSLHFCLGRALSLFVNVEESAICEKVQVGNQPNRGGIPQDYAFWERHNHRYENSLSVSYGIQHGWCKHRMGVKEMDIFKSLQRRITSSQYSVQYLGFTHATDIFPVLSGLVASIEISFMLSRAPTWQHWGAYIFVSSE